MQNEKVEIIANDQGNRTTPSYVSFDDVERYIGDSAKANAVKNLKNTVFDAKRLIGRKFDDPHVQQDLKYFPFDVVKNNDGGCNVRVSYKGETKEFVPEEISAMVLTKMKEISEMYLGKKVSKAVETLFRIF